MAVTQNAPQFQFSKMTQSSVLCCRGSAVGVVIADLVLGLNLTGVRHASLEICLRWLNSRLPYA